MTSTSLQPLFSTRPHLFMDKPDIMHSFSMK